jgi:hypothetical protein
MKFFLSVLVIQLIVFTAYSQEKIVLPRNETGQDPSLATFVAELKKAITDQNADWIKSVLDKDVMSSLGDEPGIESFLNYWTPENNSTDFWPYLKRAVDMGGVFLHDQNDESGRFQFVFPYVYDIEMDQDDDYYMIGAITGKNVNLRSAPDTKSKVITQLSHHVIYFNYEDQDMSNVALNSCGDPEWYLIETYDKKYKGWVNWQYVYSVTGPRLFLFKDQKGRWKISAFVAGD